MWDDQISRIKNFILTTAIHKNEDIVFIKEQVSGLYVTLFFSGLTTTDDHLISALSSKFGCRTTVNTDENDGTLYLQVRVPMTEHTPLSFMQRIALVILTLASFANLAHLIIHCH